MSMLAQTDDGDIQITNNGFTLVTGKAQIRQRLINNLRTFFGEWFLDLTLGVPYFQLIFEKGTSPEIIEALIKDAILDTEGIIALDRFEPLDYDPGTRLLTVDFTARTVDDETIEVTEELG